MKNPALFLASAVAGAVALSNLAGAQTAPAPKPDFKFEKCYGLVKAGQNDCQTAASSCAGTSKRDNQPDAWVYVPAGLCGKLAGASIEPKKS